MRRVLPEALPKASGAPTPLETSSLRSTHSVARRKRAKRPSISRQDTWRATQAQLACPQLIESSVKHRNKSSLRSPMESSCRQPKTSKDSFRLRDTEVLNITRKTMVGKQKLSYTQQFVNKMPAFFVLADWQVEMYYCERVREGSVTVRDRVYLFLASPSSSTGGMLIGFAVWLISAASVYSSRPLRRSTRWRLVPGMMKTEECQAVLRPRPRHTRRGTLPPW